MKNIKRQNRAMKGLGLFLMVFGIKFLPLDLVTKQDWAMLFVIALGFLTYVYGVEE